MPTREEWEKLRDAIHNGKVNRTLATKEEIKGLLLTEDSKELFFPACGSVNNSSISDVNFWGHYWSNLHSIDDEAYEFKFLDDPIIPVGVLSNCVYFGFTIRGVLDDK